MRRAFAEQARGCERLGSPFTARLMRVLERGLDRSTRTGRAVLDWQGVADAGGDAVPLRLAGALNALARSGTRPALAGAWPPAPTPDEATLERIVSAALADDDETLLDWLARPPQTNEVGRSAAVYAALMHVAGTHRLPIRLFELGASGGLNLLCDRYGYTLGGLRCGARDSAVQFEPEWEGEAPEGIDPVVIARRGCDRAPLDVRDPLARERLLAYVWPDQRARVERLEAALDIARDAPPRVDEADAADWIEARLPPTGEPGATRVVLHTIARQYFPADVEARVAARIERCGEGATPEAPFAHVSFEQDAAAAGKGPALDLTVWPGGQTIRLAHAQAHGSAFVWHGAVERPSR